MSGYNGLDEAQATTCEAVYIHREWGEGKGKGDDRINRERPNPEEGGHEGAPLFTRVGFC